MSQTIRTLQDAEAYAAAHGIALTPADRAKVAQVQAAERARLEELRSGQQATFADRWNEFYPRILQAILTTGETVLTFTQTVLVALGAPVVLVLLMIVEHQRVVHGIMLFEADLTLASFAAAALVIANLVLELTIHYVEHKAGYVENRAAAWSFRIWLQNAAYTAGIGSHWTARELSPANRWRKLLRLITFTILALALGGSMRAVIEATDGAWYHAIISIVTESNLSLLMTWAGGLLFAAAAVLGAQGLTRYVAMKATEAAREMDARTRQDADPYKAEMDAAGAALVLAIVNDKLSKRAAKAAPVAPVVHPVNVQFVSAQEHPADPLAPAAAGYSNGNGNGRH